VGDPDQRLPDGAVLMATRRRAFFAALLVLSDLSIAPAARSARPEQAATAPALAQLAQDAKNPSAKVRRQAVRGLRERGGPETLPLLASLVTDPELDIREWAIADVIMVYVFAPPKQSIGSAAEGFDIGQFRVTPWPVPSELADALVKALADREPSVRRDSAYAVGIIMPAPAPSRVAFELAASLSDRDASVRIAAARALGRLQVQSAGVPLIGRVNDDDLDVRLAAMRALGDLREKQSVAALTEQFSFYIRGSAGRSSLDALASIAAPSSIPLFETQLTSGYPAHRKSAYEGLARSGRARDAAPRIEAAMAKEKDRRVLTAMAYALASAGRPGIERIFEALADRSLADDAMLYLVELGSAYAPAIAARMSDPNPVVREQIAIVLGFVGGPAAAAALKGASAESDASVRRAIDVAQFRLTRGPRA
jgi:HEAT repeat protein